MRDIYYSLLGDIAFTGIISTQPELNFKRFKDVIPILGESDIVFANLEVPLKVDDSANEYKNLIHFSLLEPTRDLLRLLNIGCVSLANNHIYDCKMNGLKTTIEMLDELGIYHTGAGWKSEHIDPVIIEKEGFKIAFIATVHKNTNPKTEHFPELFINYFSQNEIKMKILSLRSRVDLIICSIHWGSDYSYYPEPDQLAIARELVNSGADIIMGHHTHTFQPFEKFGNGYIFYSLGSFTFGDYIKEGKSELQALFRKTKKSAIVRYTIESHTLDLVPVKELKGNYHKVDKRNLFAWSQMMWLHYMVKHSSVITRKLYDFNENVLYRIFEYFFGYYKNPVKRLFQFSNLKKIKRLK